MSSTVLKGTRFPFSLEQHVIVGLTSTALPTERQRHKERKQEIALEKQQKNTELFPETSNPSSHTLGTLYFPTPEQREPEGTISTRVATTPSQTEAKTEHLAAETQRLTNAQ